MRIFEKWKQGLQWMKIQDGIGEPPWEYDFLYNLPKSEYPKYLKKIFEYRTRENLPLKYDFKLHNYIIDKNKCKTFNQKIQWIKLYDATPLKRDCTDKVNVRWFVSDCIGSEYLKPVLQVVRSEESGVRSNNFKFFTLNSPLFDQIDFDKLPDSFVIKCNHGCKWHYIIKNKNDFLNNKQIYNKVKQNITGWLEQEFWVWSGFELNYRGIQPKILIEPFMCDYEDKNPEKIQCFCFNGIPQLSMRIEKGENNKTTLYDKNLKITDDVLSENDEKVNKAADDILYQSFELSKKLSKDFNFVRADWMIYQNKLYFEELTFTPYSGFHKFKNNILDKFEIER